jgi:hypothetical protein
MGDVSIKLLVIMYTEEAGNCAELRKYRISKACVWQWMDKEELCASSTGKHFMKIHFEKALSLCRRIALKNLLLMCNNIIFP